MKSTRLQPSSRGTSNLVFMLYTLESVLERFFMWMNAAVENEMLFRTELPRRSDTTRLGVVGTSICYTHFSKYFRTVAQTSAPSVRNYWGDLFAGKDSFSLTTIYDTGPPTDQPSSSRNGLLLGDFFLYDNRICRKKSLLTRENRLTLPSSITASFQSCLSKIKTTNAR